MILEKLLNAPVYFHKTHIFLLVQRLAEMQTFNSLVSYLFLECSYVIILFYIKVMDNYRHAKVCYSVKINKMI